MTTFFFSSG